MPYADKEESLKRRRAYYLSNRDRLLADCRARYLRNKDRIKVRACEYRRKNRARLTARSLDWARRNPIKRRYNALQSLSSRVGWAKICVSQDEFIVWYESRNQAACGCCGEPFNGDKKHVDHHHVTGELRGLVCHQCNTAEGLIRTRDRWLAMGQYMGWANDPLA